MIRRFENGTLYHEVVRVTSEPGITKKGDTFVVSKQRQIRYSETLPKGRLVLVVSQATRRARGPATITLTTSNDVSTEFYLSLLRTNPVEVVSTPQHRYLWVDNAFYEAESSLIFEQAVALARESDLKKARKIQRAVEATQASQLGTRVTREAISDVVKHHIWTRDEGRCVGCGSSTDLQFDHVIPLAMGGSNELANLQLLCAACNRRKGANLTVNPLPSHLVGSMVRVPKSTAAPIFLQTDESYIPGPKYLLVPGSLPNSGISESLSRLHEIGRAEAVRMIAETKTFADEFLDEVCDMGDLVNEATESSIRLADWLASKTDVSGQRTESIHEGSGATKQGKKCFRKLEKRFLESSATARKLIDQGVKAFPALTAMTSQALVLKEKMNSAPDPGRTAGEQRAAFWVGYLNELHSLKRNQRSSVNYGRFLEAKLRLEEDAEALMNFCTSMLTVDSFQSSHLERAVESRTESSPSQFSDTSPEISATHLHNLALSLRSKFLAPMYQGDFHNLTTDETIRDRLQVGTTSTINGIRYLLVVNLLVAHQKNGQVSVRVSAWSTSENGAIEGCLTLAKTDLPGVYLTDKGFVRRLSGRDNASDMTQRITSYLSKAKKQLEDQQFGCPIVQVRETKDGVTYDATRSHLRVFGGHDGAYARLVE
jgi:hypothetical protein